MGDEITIGPVRDADTGEIETPASETGSGDGSNELGAENFDNDNVSSFDPENNTEEDEDDFSDVDTGGDDDSDFGGDSGGDIQDQTNNSEDDSPNTTAVVVTENEQGEQVTVGQGTDTQEARVDAALNPDFDAAPGEEVDAFETAADTGLGDGTGPDALINDSQQETRQRQTKQQDKQNIFEENIERAQEFQAGIAARNRREQQIIQDQGQLSAEARTIRGVQALRTADRITEETREAIPRSVDIPATNAAVRTLESGADLASQVTGGNQGEKVGETVETFQRSSIAGIPAGPVALAGLGVGATGATQLALRDETPSIQTGAVKGAELTAEQLESNPAEFAGSEVGEEVGEAAAGALVGGTAGAAAGAIPTVTPSISLDSIRNFDPSQTRKGSAAIGQPDNNIGPGRTPGPVAQPDPTPSQDLTGADLQTQIEQQAQTETQTQSQQQDTTGFDIQTRPIIDFTDQTASEPVSQPDTKPITEPQTEPQIQIESRPETRTEATPRVETRPEVIAEPIVETRPEPEIIPEVRPETRIDPSPRPRPRGVDQRSEQVLGFVEPPATVEQASDTPSIDAILLGIEEDSENKDEEPSVFTGFETRPIEDDSDVFDVL
jgi:hypothetical protein